MIDAMQAQHAATEALETLRREQDPILPPAPTSAAGAPVMVSDVAGLPSYWLVPVLDGGRSIGFVRIGPDGGTMAIGVTRGPGRRMPHRADPVTGLSAEEALARARAAVALAAGEAFGAPRFVHDGPPGREAWLVETIVAARPRRWIFVSAAGTYERPAGVRFGENPGVE